jgi:hypothetical protein
MSNYWCQLHAMLGTNIPPECGSPTQELGALELVVAVLFSAFLLICIECILQMSE